MTDDILLTEAYRQAKKRLLLLDYDGTLTGFKPHPSQAKPSSRLLRVLERLASNPRNTLVIISGRDQSTLGNWLSHLPLTLVAEHGYAVKHAALDWQPRQDADDRWKTDVRPCMTDSSTSIDGSFIEEKAASLVWHYRAAHNQEAAAQEAERLMQKLRAAAGRHGLSLLPGSKAVEAKLKTVNKGAAAKGLLAGENWDFILAAGDDVTDEDLFGAMPKDAHTIKIGSGTTKAKLRLPDPDAMLGLLESLQD